jgi:Flp pilus assembly protein TadD
MISTPAKWMAVVALGASALAPHTWAKDVSITIPMRSNLSPVQRLNREGVEAVAKRQYEKAEGLFYKAYLYDPADPFTLNNLGFVSELRGQLDRAQKFYHLASEQSCNAVIDLSSSKSLEKKPMRAALGELQDLPMRVNRMNVEAMRLIGQDRAFEAVALLQQALALDPANPFTLNNLGVADEAVGDYQGALQSYRQAASSRSSEPVMVTQDHTWSGKSVSAMAEEGAKRLQKRMQQGDAAETQAAILNMRGVLAANQNDWKTAEQYFQHAYSVDPGDAFSLNNRGYVAEREGDLESAQFFYEKARRAGDAGNRVGYATNQSDEGRALNTVAGDSDQKVDGALAVYSRERRRETGPVELTPRGNGAVTPSAPDSHQQQSAPNATPPPTPQQPQP